MGGCSLPKTLLLETPLPEEGLESQPPGAQPGCKKERPGQNVKMGGKTRANPRGKKCARATTRKEWGVMLPARSTREIGEEIPGNSETPLSGRTNALGIKTFNPLESSLKGFSKPHTKQGKKIMPLNENK